LRFEAAPDSGTLFALLLSELVFGEAYAYSDYFDQAWESGSARKAIYVRRVHDRNALPINQGIEWMFGHPHPVKGDPEVLVATQWDFTGLVGRRASPRVEVAGGEWRPAVVGRKQLICRWTEFEERIRYLYEVGRQYQTFFAQLRWQLRRARITTADIVSVGSWTAFEPEKVVVRIAGQSGLVLGRDVPVPARLEFPALEVLKVPGTGLRPERPRH
jgi:hypothetical protein